MTKDFFSDGALVYDRYYCNKPHTPLLVIKRIMLAVVFCVCSMLFILTEYEFPVSLPAMGAVCGISCAVFSAILVFIKKRWLLAGVLAVSGIGVWLNFGILADKLTYFADACMLLFEGRFLYPGRYIFHKDEVLNAYNQHYTDGVVLGTVLMCLLYGLIISLCFSGKLRPIIPALLFAAMCVPVLISEHIEFSFWLVPALAALVGAFAIRKNYSEGLAVKNSSLEDYRRRMRSEERSFIRHVSSASVMKRTEMRCNYYSKYFSSGMYGAALAAVCLLVGAAVIPEGGSIDYTGVYEFFAGFGDSGESGETSFEESSASEYFTHSSSQEELLNIISPGRGEREMLLVTYEGSRPFYLRGDVGIDFTGKAWTTVVGSEPEEWSSSGLKDSYRPCENRVINALLLASTDNGVISETDNQPVIYEDHVSIDYLCSTDVVFLPPYTVDYSFYDSELFDVYGDYAVRVSENAGNHVNSVECVALIPSYTSNELYDGDADGLAEIEKLFGSARCTPNDIYSSVVPEMQQDDILSDYEEYVLNTYLSIPESYAQDIESYIRRCLYDELQQLEDQRASGELSEAQYRYRLANFVAEYLRTNYTYSLDGSNNSSEPVLQFLNETKSGHCSLYASAMTLILRELGVPARYCTGFYVEAADGSNSVLLRERNLHAWVEVYIGQYGWVTFDPTSSSAYPERDNANGESTVVTNEADSGELLSEESDVSEHQDAVNSKHETEQSEFVNAVQTAESLNKPDASSMKFQLLLIPLIVCAAAAAIVGIVLLVRVNSLKRSAGNTLESLRIDVNSSHDIFLLMLALLEHLKISPQKGELPQSFWKRVDLRFGTCLEAQTELLEAMEFGSQDASAEAHDVLYAQLERIVNDVKPFSFPWKTSVLRLIRDMGITDGEK